MVVPVTIQRRFGRLTATIAAFTMSCGILLCTSGSSNSAPPYPGLPDIQAQLSVATWFGVGQAGIAYSAKTAQWGKVPMQISAAFYTNGYLKDESQWLPWPDRPPREAVQEAVTHVTFVSPPGAKHNYGISPEFSVRTVAFGAIPAEATLRMVQARQADGTPKPLVAMNQRMTLVGGNRWDESDTYIDDAMTIEVTGLSIDGNDLGLRQGCQTSTPAPLKLIGKGKFHGQADIDPVNPALSGHFLPAKGGLIQGTVTIPDFTGCVTSSGEDVSRLLTTSVSGEAMPVRLHVTAPACGRPVPPALFGLGPPPPGAITPEEAGCAALTSVLPEVKIPPRS
jgi:hypothetical protein